MSCFASFVPEKSVKILQCWVDDLDVDIKILNPRKTKLGDFKVRDNKLYITINKNLNQYSFLITLIHELAHAFVFKKHKKYTLPHGKEWKKTFKSLMFHFLTPDYFPEDILKVLAYHMINPKASTYSDLDLVRILKQYNKKSSVTISDLRIGEYFKMSNGKIFLKGGTKRKRVQCVESKTDKTYLFHPLTEITRIN